jgi:hypothetical protein
VVIQHSDYLLPPAVDKVEVVVLHLVDLEVALVAHTGVRHKDSLVNQLLAHHRTERTSPHTAQTAESHTHTVSLVTQCRPVAVAVAVQLLPVATPHNQVPIVQAALAEMVAKDLQTTGAPAPTLCTDLAVVVRHALYKALAAPMVERRAAQTPQVAQASMQSTKQAQVVAVDTVKAVDVPVMAVREL